MSPFFIAHHFQVLIITLYFQVFLLEGISQSNITVSSEPFIVGKLKTDVGMFNIKNTRLMHSVHG